MAWFTWFDPPDLPRWLWRLWYFLADRPILPCPDCCGSGASVTGYPYYEADECSTCWRSWERCDDAGFEWAVGRLPPFRWLRMRLTTGIATRRVRDLIRCRLGWHGKLFGGVCSRCYKQIEEEPRDAT